MTPVFICAYEPADDDALALFDERLRTEATRLPLIRRAHAAGGAWVAKGEDALVGYLCRTFEFYDHDFIALVVTAAAWRKRGVASALIHAAEAVSRRDRIFTSTNESNAPMRALLAKRGYLTSGRIDNLDPGDPELVFVKFLGS